MASQHVADQNNVIASDMAMGNVFPDSSPHPALFLAPCTFTFQHRGGSQKGFRLVSGEGVQAIRRFMWSCVHREDFDGRGEVGKENEGDSEESGLQPLPGEVPPV